MLAGVIAIGAAVFCGSLALALEGDGVRGGGIEGRVVIEGGSRGGALGGDRSGDRIVEGRSVSVDGLSGGAFLNDFNSPCFPHGYDDQYLYGIYGACPPR